MNRISITIINDKEVYRFVKRFKKGEKIPVDFLDTVKATLEKVYGNADTQRVS